MRKVLGTFAVLVGLTVLTPTPASATLLVFDNTPANSVGGTIAFGTTVGVSNLVVANAQIDTVGISGSGTPVSLTGACGGFACMNLTTGLYQGLGSYSTVGALLTIVG